MFSTSKKPFLLEKLRQFIKDEQINEAKKYVKEYFIKTFDPVPK